MNLLEELDETAKEGLASADGYMKTLELNLSLQHLATAFDATYLMAFICGSPALGDNSFNLTRIMTPNVYRALERFDLTSDDLREAYHNMIQRDFSKEEEYIFEDVRSDYVSISVYGKMIKHAQHGCFLDAEKLLHDKNQRISGDWLDKPPVSNEAVQKVINYAKKHGKDGLEFWLQHAENYVNEGYVSYPTEIPRYAREKINAYTVALGVSFPEERFQNILKINAKNVALKKVEIFKQVRPEFIGETIDKRRKWLEDNVAEAKEYAQQARFGWYGGLLYNYQLWEAKKIAEERLLLI